MDNVILGLGVGMLGSSVLLDYSNKQNKWYKACEIQYNNHPAGKDKLSANIQLERCLEHMKKRAYFKIINTPNEDSNPQ